MRYRRYMLVVDFFGFLAFLSIFGYLFLPDGIRPTGRLNDFWGNASAELAGIWISVRLIEWALRQSDLNLKIRVRSVRSMRMLVGQLMHFLDSGFVGALRRLDAEIAWCKQRLPQRLRHLKPDEVHDMMAFYDALDDIRAMIPKFHEYREKDKDFLSIVNSAEFLEKLALLGNLRDRAETNILQETDEDEGLAV